jgi:16S rRNA (uracil1498-N3)-methyltransferase
MARFFLSPDAWAAPVLTGDEAKHAAQVLRLRCGDRLTVFDGTGRSAPAEITTIARSEVGLRLGETVVRPLTGPRLHLAQAVPKGKTMDLIVQKAVELGVASIQPLITRRTVVQVEAEETGRKSGKWQRVALEACKQCGQDLLPQVLPVSRFTEWLLQPPGGLRVIASLAPGSRPLRELLRDVDPPTDATLLIGPEGDFTPEETDAALAAGFQPASLGPIVLRAETAAIFAISALRYEFSHG